MLDQLKIDIIKGVIDLGVIAGIVALGVVLYALYHGE